MRCDAARRVADTSEIRQGMRQGAARNEKVSCFKMDRVVSLALLCEVLYVRIFEVLWRVNISGHWRL